MTIGQQRAWDRNWDALGRDMSTLDGLLDLGGWFGRQAPVLLEIGSGMGEATVELAAAAPELNHLAVEVYEPGLAQLLLRIESSGVANLRLLRGDAVVLLREHIAPDSLAGARIFFPDPWPKKRHHKRRLINPSFVELLISRLAVDATVHLATDWQHYADQMMAVCSAESKLCNEYAGEPGGWAPRPPWRPITKFERRAEQEGRISRDLIFRRC